MTLSRHHSEESDFNIMRNWETEQNIWTRNSPVEKQGHGRFTEQFPRLLGQGYSWRVLNSGHFQTVEHSPGTLIIVLDKKVFEALRCRDWQLEFDWRCEKIWKI